MKAGFDTCIYFPLILEDKIDPSWVALLKLLHEDFLSPGLHYVSFGTAKNAGPVCLLDESAKRADVQVCGCKQACGCKQRDQQCDFHMRLGCGVTWWDSNPHRYGDPYYRLYYTFRLFGVARASYVLSIKTAHSVVFRACDPAIFTECFWPGAQEQRPPNRSGVYRFC